jgi:hypothetical protein
VTFSGPFVAGLILVTYWYSQRGGRYTGIFFGSGRQRPYQPKIR